MALSIDPFKSSSRAAAHLRPLQQQLTTDRSLRLAAQGDLLVDVLRSDSANLLDLPFLADVFDDFMDDAVALPGTTSPFADGFAGNPRLVTTTSTSQMPMLKHETLRTNSSGESSDNTKASGSGTGAPAVTKGTHASKQPGLGQDAAFSMGALSDGMGSKDRKKRTRNQQQMEHNRVAQQKYRERKKNETQELQSAVELLTAELAAMKALEVRASELESHNLVLQQQVLMQSQQVQQLESKVTEQEAKISTQASQLGTQLEMLTSQQKMILDQHQKLQLQEEIICSLKDRLKESVDRAWDSIEATTTDPHVVCRRMHEAVLEALRGAKNVEGLQETLATLPDELVVEICKNIMITCKDLFPQLAEKMSKCGAGGKLPQNCAVAAQVSGPSH